MSDHKQTKKTCTKCKITQELEAFARNRRRKDGRSGWCRACHREWDRKNRPPKGREDHTGQRYGYLTIVSEYPGGPNRSRLVDCSCDCGGTKTTRLRSVLNGVTTSCGCAVKRNGKLWGAKCSRYSGHGDITGTFWNSVRQGAKARNLDFEVSIEDAWKLFLDQERKCALSGVDLAFGAPRSTIVPTASLDRIDNAKNYTIDNVQWVHKIVNIMRNVLTVEEFRGWCKKIVEQEYQKYD